LEQPSKKAQFAIKYCTFVNNSAANGDRNDVFASSANVVSDCSLSLQPQLVVGIVVLRLLFAKS
jgi:hypothetical protein